LPICTTPLLRAASLAKYVDEYKDEQGQVRRRGGKYGGGGGGVSLVPFPFSGNSCLVLLLLQLQVMLQDARLGASLTLNKASEPTLWEEVEKARLRQ